MKRVLLFVTILSLPLDLWAGSSAQLRLAGTVQEKIDYQIKYDIARHRWILQQTTNGHLRASLEKTTPFHYVVSVRAP